MRILSLHCKYRQPGGEDAVAAAEAQLLRSRGHTVREYVASNRPSATGTSWLTTLSSLAASAWNSRVYAHIRREIRIFQPDVMHVHNFWFALSPAVFGAAADENLPAILSVHNYRLVCPGALLMRKGRPCEICVGHSPWRAVPRRCYRNSALLTALVARMISANRSANIWHGLIGRYIALTNFSRELLIAGGIPAERISVKPNGLPTDPGVACGRGEGAIFVGRLATEKGIYCLAKAWEAVPHQLCVLGDGPLRRQLVSHLPEGRARILGHLATQDVAACIKESRLLVLPSIWYECFPRVLLEAYACGRPVVASRLGALPELIKDGETGLLFEPGNTQDLETKVNWLFNHPKECERMGRNARAEYEVKYAAAENYKMLMNIYHQVT